MIDAVVRRFTDPPMDRAGRWAAGRGLSANAATLLGLGFGLASAVCVWNEIWTVAVLLIALSRLADGLDGAIARATRRTDFGGLLDISCDFLFYGAIPLAFVLRDPGTNGAAGAWLLTSFYFNGATFLGFAILAERRGLQAPSGVLKSIHFSDGLLEGSETIAFLVVICFFPTSFPTLAWIFGALSFVTGAQRLVHARKVFLH